MLASCLSIATTTHRSHVLPRGSEGPAWEPWTGQPRTPTPGAPTPPNATRVGSPLGGRTTSDGLRSFDRHVGIAPVGNSNGGHHQNCHMGSRSIPPSFSTGTGFCGLPLGPAPSCPGGSSTICFFRCRRAWGLHRVFDLVWGGLSPPFPL